MRIIYLNPFENSAISGGINTAYRHVELLREIGYDAYIWQPSGKATWLETNAAILSDQNINFVKPNDVLVFPESLHNDVFLPFLTSVKSKKKLLFVQNQYNLFNRLIPAKKFSELGFDDILCCSIAVKDFFENVFKFRHLSIIPCYVDRERFKPINNQLQIALTPRKLPGNANFILQVFRIKYPEFFRVNFIAFQDAHEKKVAEILGQSAVLLALSNRESFGLVPVEAMAAGCLIAGYHGYGGLEYANPANGFWYGADENEKVADSIAHLLRGIESGADWVAAMRAATRATVQRYDRQSTKLALLTYFKRLDVHPTL